MDNLTLKQKDFFEKLKEAYSSYALPSFETIKKDFNYKSKNSIAQFIHSLKEKGYIVEKDSRNYINQNKLGANFLNSKVRAGFASVMDDAIDKLISFDEILNINSPSTFVFKVSGDSMVELGIFEGDFVTIKKTSDAKDGDVVLANIDGGFTLKTYKKSPKGVYLQPANINYPNIYPQHSLSIFGIATGIVRRL